MNRWAMILTLGALATGLLAAGCGDGDSGEDVESTISKAEFVKKADAICKQASQEVLDQFEKGGNADFAKLIFVSYEKEVDEMEALGAPEGDEAQIDAFLRPLDEGAKAWQQPNEAIRANELIKQSRKMMKEYGVKFCPGGE